ncbi:Spy/CpxP family protein refolding chaperone [Planctomycetota bacterium]|nr:Spy/CpxP family protein refolding chaperone [Planctomycetota bacterium]
MQFSKIALAAAIVLTGSLCISSAFANEARPRKEKQKTQQRQVDREARQQDGSQKEMHDKHGNKRGNVRKIIFKDIELTADQKEQIKEIHQEATAERKEWNEENRDKLDSLKEKLRDARKAGDKEEAAKIHKEIKTLMETGPRRSETFEAVKNVLTADQVEQFEKNIEKLRENKPKHKGDKAQKRHRGNKEEGKRGNRN